MLRHLIETALFLILISQAAKSEIEICTETHNSVCYKIPDSPVDTVFDADQKCQSSILGRLVKADTEVKRQLLVKIMKAKDCKEVLIGLNELSQRGVPRWLDGSLFTDNSLWEVEGPGKGVGNSDKHCVTLLPNGKLKKRNCNKLEKVCAICESGKDLPEGKPDYTWTPWISSSTPSINNAYEKETLASVRAVNPNVCTSPLDVECRVVGLGVSWNVSDDSFQIPCSLDGLLCQNSAQKTKLCNDYEVRFLCSPDVDECATGAAGCDPNAICTNNHGSFSCQCKPGYYGNGKTCNRVGVCTAWGDPHYRTFDGVPQDFMGVCKYTFTETCSQAPPNLTAFAVHVANENRNNNSRVSYTKMISLTVGGSVFTLSRGRSRGILTINGVEKTPPQQVILTENNLLVTATYNTRGIELLTDFGVSVQYDGVSRVEVRAPDAYKGYLCGMCGNFDGNPQNDLKTRSGKTAVDRDEWGNSWLHSVQDDPKCVNANTTYPKNLCTEEQNDRVQARCKALTTEPAFQDCWKDLPPSFAFEGCVFDMCSDPSNDKLACSAFNDYAKQCEAFGILVKWRGSTGCNPECGVNEHYEEDTSGCQDSCDEPYAESSCYYGRTSGCVCNEGFVRSGTTCVPLSECGCKDDNNNYRRVGDEWFTNKCATRYVCDGLNSIRVDSDVTCGSTGECVQIGSANDYDCRCKAGFQGKSSNCTDVNECVSMDKPCHAMASCTNQHGSYTCQCNPGFTGNGFTNCEDINECLRGTDTCSPYATCINDVGSYHCLCDDGYTGDGFKCDRNVINATNEEQKGCSFHKDATCEPQSECVDLPGGDFQCVCWEGGVGDGMRGVNRTGCTFPKCPSENMFLHRTFCYVLTENTGTYQQTSDYCNNQGGELLTLVDLMQQNEIRNLADSQKWTGSYYTGYTATYYPGTFMPKDFSVAQEVSFGWSVGQPNTNGTKFCAAFSSSTGYAMSAVDCQSQLKGICKIPTYKRMCSDGWRLQGNRCVALMPSNATALEASLICARWGADLYKVKEPADRAFVYSRFLVSKSGGSFWISAPGGCTAIKADSSVYKNLNCEEKRQFFCEKPVYVYYRCPTGSEYYNGDCYAISSVKGSKTTADGQCQNYGGQSASIESSAEQAFIEYYLNGIGKLQELWIGLNENPEIAKLYTWADKSQFEYTNWATGQPNADAGDCTHLSVSGKSLPWKEASCNNKSIAALCEYVNTPCVKDDDCNAKGYCQLGQCRCSKGYLGDGKLICTDIDECQIAGVCPGNLTCTNTLGSFSCGCSSDYIAVDNFCRLATYCTQHSDCHRNGYCRTNNTCTCSAGYAGNGKNCTDIDECSSPALSPNCDENAFCTNTLGSYTCACKPGFRFHTVNTTRCVPYPQTCHDYWLMDPKSPNTTYLVDIDREGPLPPYTVDCEMRLDMGVTKVRVSQTTDYTVKLIQPQSDVNIIKYVNFPDPSRIRVIVGLSGFCYQSVRYTCEGAVNLMENTLVEGGDNKKSNSWGFDGRPGFCECGVSGCCGKQRAPCNCDGSYMSVRRTDQGTVVNPDLLPVLKVYSGLGNTTSFGRNAAYYRVFDLYCGPNVFDIPRTCLDYSTQKAISTNFPISPLMIHPRGSTAFPVCCEGPITRLAPDYYYGYTIRVPLVYEGPLYDPPGTPSNPGAPNCVTYPVSQVDIDALISISASCTQEVLAVCSKGQSLFQDNNVLINLKDKSLSYFPGGTEGKCACGVLGSCENSDSVCNCDGLTDSYDFGFIRNKSDLPVQCLGPKSPQQKSTPLVTVGPLKCGPSPFGLEPNCIEWKTRGYTRRYVYQVDVDGGSLDPRSASESLAQCTMDDVPYITIPVEVVESTSCANPLANNLCCLEVKYPGYTTDEVRKIVDNAAYCTQDISYTCQNMPLTKLVNGVPTTYAFWRNYLNKTRSYFHGSDNINYVGCACGQEGSCKGCQCDGSGSTEKTDSGTLSNKADLPVLQLCLGKKYNDPTVRSEQKLGPLKCYYAYSTCQKRKSANDRYTGEKKSLPIVPVPIDVDGPGPLPPNTLSCNQGITVIDPDVKEYTFTEKHFGPNSYCVDVNYGNMTLNHLLKLTEGSSYCTQYGALRCTNALKTGYITLYGSDGKEIKGWFGNAGGTKCACGEVGACVNPSQDCNCDSKSSTETLDHGILVDKSVLPITKICVGLPETKPDQGVRSITISLSSLQCTDSQFNLYSDCQKIRESFNANRYKEVFMRNLESQAWVIDADGSGKEKPFTVYCEMTETPPVGVTILNPVQACVNSTEAADVMYSYGQVTDSQIQALLKTSLFCEQSLSYQCLKAPLQLDDVANGAFDAANARFNTWGTNGCEGGECECDTSSQIHTDKGRFYDKTRLPIKKVHLPEVTDSQGKRSLCAEPLKCYNLLNTCQELALAGRLSFQSIGEVFAVMPQPQKGLGYFGVNCRKHTQLDIYITSSVSTSVTVSTGTTSLNYNFADSKQLHLLAYVSAYCSQELLYSCKASGLLGLNISRVSDYQGDLSQHWVGAVPSENFVTPASECTCNRLGTCGEPDLKCRCDAKKDVAIKEGGVFLNKTALPLAGSVLQAVPQGSVASLTILPMSCAVKPFDLPATCIAAKAAGKETGEVTLLPNCLTSSPIDVYCDIDGGLYKNSTIAKLPTLFGTKAVSASASVNYPSGDVASIRCLVSASRFCLQYIRFESTGARLSNKFYWVGANGNRYNFFAGGSTKDFCPCKSAKACASTPGDTLAQVEARKCNADLPLPSDTSRLVDVGYISDLTALPVVGVYYNGSADEAALAKWSVGPLMCSDVVFDVDECVEGLAECDANAKCTNTFGSYTCQCNVGWRGMEKAKDASTGRTCYDDDECSNPKACPTPQSYCVNTPGSFKCPCSTGYALNSNNTCVDIDECKLNTHDCDSNANCINTIGSYSCICKAGFRGTGKKDQCYEVANCFCFGDPHCFSWDGRWLHYQGSCRYTLARDNCKDGVPQGEPNFSVTQKNWRRNVPAQKVSWTKEVLVRIDNTTILLQQQYRVVVNSRAITLPYTPPAGDYSIQFYGMNVAISFAKGMLITWDGTSRVEVLVTKNMQNTVCGLCGNYNQDPADDWVIGPVCDNNGTQTDDATLFGDSWRDDNPVDTDPDCNAVCTTNVPEPECKEPTLSKAKGACGELKRRFAACAAVMKNVSATDMDDILYTCEYDYCQATTNAQSVVCEQAALLAAICLTKFQVSVSYMENGFCMPSCGPNMEYKKSGSPCQASCTQTADQVCNVNLTAKVEGCFCKSGYVMESGNCIKPEQCGCQMTDGSYFKVGSSYTFPDCSKICECTKARSNTTCRTITCNSNAVCNETNGVRGCYCKDGFTGDGTRCTDINECTQTPYPCHKNANCTNTPGSYKCDCSTGFQGDGKVCDNINECDNVTRPYPCDANTEECFDLVPSFECRCKEGYIRVNGSKTCGDKNECVGTNNLCERSSTTCINLPGSYKCECKKGYVPRPNNTYVCDDINECLDPAQNNCTTENGRCENVPGTFVCKCDTGYRFDGKACTDINECKESPTLCNGTNTRCVNKPGGYECECIYGTSGNSSNCKVPDPCVSMECPDNSECKDGACLCSKGYKKGSGPPSAALNCSDIDECELHEHDCSTLATCNNVEGGYVCVCLNGYEWNPVTKKCENINECTSGIPDICNKYAVCKDTIGGYYCECDVGFTGHCDECRDVDECEKSQLLCDPDNGICTNTIGSYKCTCKPGFDGDGKSCVDIDECSRGGVTCNGFQQTCINTYGSFECECSAGYAKDENGTCTDYNECLNSKNECSPKGICVNKPGSYECKCQTGYKGDGVICIPDDKHNPCGDGICPLTAYCLNDMCVCKPGYTGDGVTCKDVNECDTRGVCDSHATCENIPGSYFCNCLPGYKGNGLQCFPDKEDICLHENFCKGGKCFNNTCTCKEGYELINSVCVDINECNQLSEACPGMICENTLGSYICDCSEGLRLNEVTKTCEDVNECEDGSHHCQKNSKCLNLYGSYQCYCPAGKFDVNGDGSWCENVVDNSCGKCHLGAYCVNGTCTCLPGMTKKEEAGGKGPLCVKEDKSCKEDSCQENAVCRENTMGFSCRCKEGYKSVSGACVDINECGLGLHSCDESERQECQNTPGSYKCACSAGYKHSDDGKSCKPLKECKCGPHGFCNKDNVCICASGYQVSVSGECEDINECLDSSSCHTKAICTNLKGSYKCECLPGYSGNPYSYCDLDECALGLATCNNNEKCVNLVDSYACVPINCPDGLSLVNGICVVDSQLCRMHGPCGKNAVCVAHTGQAHCQCQMGFSGDGNACVDINECLSGNVVCPQNSVCLNSIGSYECVCRSGYAKPFGYEKNNTVICEDINECEMKGACAENANCTNVQGSYICTCNRGYVGVGKYSCEEDTKCRSTSGCHPKARCQKDKEGIYGCKCLDGYDGDGVTECTDSDPCRRVHGQSCHENADCVVTNTSMKCQCREGFVGDGHQFCEAENKCLNKGKNKCNVPLEVCKNTEDGYICECGEGGLDIDGLCIDVDECSPDGTPHCSQHAVCNNTLGSYTCACKDGFYGDGVNCDDIDECLLGIANCQKNEMCYNKPGGFDCACRAGLIRNGTNCVDVDECKKPNQIGGSYCSEHAKCKNLDPGYACECNKGYIGDGFTCVKRNPCDQPGICPNNNTCHVADNGVTFTCVCKFGYELKNNICVLTDPCGNAENACDNGTEVCVRMEFGYRCDCRPGYKRVDGICVDKDECDPKSPDYAASPCGSSGGICKNYPGGFQCVCPPGLAKIPGACKDKDECALNTHNCHANASCSNVVGGFSCRCKAGYEGDGILCVDKNECATNKHQCANVATCVNTIGSYQCVCPQGYVLHPKGKDCVDIDECDKNQEICGDHAACVNTLGSFVCVCDPGFNKVNNVCEDIDECKNHTNPCHENGICTNTIGSCTCKCRDGYDGDGKLHCEEKDECPPGTNANCPANTFCKMVNGKPKCTCVTGFGKRDEDCSSGICKESCDDIDECITKKGVCHPLAKCKNSAGAYLCSCPSYLHGDGKTKCEDINECASNKHTCNTTTSICVNLDNAMSEETYECQCKPGFSRVPDSKKCVDTNECLQAELNKCPPNSKCINTEGGFHCDCEDGFELSSANTCDNIDECTRIKPCGLNTICSDTEGSYQCRCVEGYARDPENKDNCIDVDECKKPNSCSHLSHGKCVNTPGNYSCVCSEGFQLVGDHCEDIDECSSAANSNVCHNSSRCTNTIGSFTCDCLPGFRTLSDGSCEEANECLEGTDRCKKINGPNSECFSLPVGYGCTCPPGFQQDPSSPAVCVDINECDTGANNCTGTGVDCFNIPGSFRCACKAGFRLENGVCVDIDECVNAEKHSPLCRPGQCKNTPGSYICVCPPGYDDSTQDCIDINECKLSALNPLAAQCGSAGECVNTPGSYKCKCPKGYTQNPLTGLCEDINECAFANACQKGICTNTEGSYLCMCRLGYTLVGGACVDLNECVEDPNRCGKPTEGVCVNLEGKFECRCNPGYRNAGELRSSHCVEINECVEKNVTAPPNAECVDAINGYTFRCKTGYRKDDMEVCRDINECVEVNDACDINADCTNTDGSYTCKCKQGFRGDGKHICALICDVHSCPNGGICRVTSANTPFCECTCVGEQCREAGPVCDDEGRTHLSEKELIEYGCKVGRALSVDYFDKCQPECDLVKCPSDEKCVMKNGKPTCECDPCTEEDKVSSPVCTKSGMQYLTMCQFKMRKCAMKIDDKIAYNGPCKRKIPCVLSNWSPWSICSRSCEIGTTTRRRAVIKPAANDGECESTYDSDQCYAGPCPRGLCETVNCPPGSYCSKGKCVCPKCVSTSNPPVCGRLGTKVDSFASLCALQQAACLANVNFTFLHEGNCGDHVPNEPSVCSVVKQYRVERLADGCYSQEPLEMNKCSGGCGSDPSICCHPTAYTPIRALFKCLDGSSVYRHVHAVATCDCTKKSNYKDGKSALGNIGKSG